MQIATSMLLMVHRRGISPTLYIHESRPLFHALGMTPTDCTMRHYLPDGARATMESGQAWRGPLQCSSTFLACFLELLCRPKGLCLEFGCGTAPILKAALTSKRFCASLDNDDNIVTGYVLPLLCPRQGQGGASTSVDVDDEGDRPIGGNPFDEL